MIEWLLHLDGQILLWIQELRTDWLTAFFTTVTHLGDAGALWILAGVALLIPKKTRRAGIAVLAALLVTFIVVNLILKPVIARTRPYEVIEGLRLLVSPAHDYSFPSGHSSSSMAAAVAMAGALPRRMRAIGWCAVVLAVMICISRLYIGIHYPSDVLIGAAIGFLCGVAGAKIASIIKMR